MVYRLFFMYDTGDFMNDMMFANKDFVFSILENSYDGIYITNKDSITVYVNKAYENLTGHKRSEYIGKHMDDLIKSGIMKVHITGDVISSKKSITVTEELVSGKNVLITGNPIFNDQNEIIAVVTNVRDISEIISLEKKERLAKEIISRYQKQIFDTATMKNIICESSNTISVFNFAAKVAPKDSTVLLTGETGVGKEVVAKYIHYNSLRKDNNYIKINCGAIPENLLESELFGYVGGAFTGADPNGKPGLFELADNGTLFLDEIGELPLNLQSSLLRVLQDGEVTRVGSTKTKKVAVRLIAATNRNLKKMIQEKTFREDLYYRLNVISINIPPLRERRDDIPPLAELFIKQLNKKYHTQKKVSETFLLELMSMSWPGNVRELSNFIERQYILNERDILSTVYVNNLSQKENFHNHLQHSLENAMDPDSFNIEKAVSSIEVSLIKKALKKSKNTKEAAKLLGISQPTFSRKYNKYKNQGIL